MAVSLHDPEDRSSRVSRRHTMPFGAALEEPAGVNFRIFAPGVQRMRLKIDGEAEILAMNARADGWHQLAIPSAGPGTRYRFVLPDKSGVPDPASRYQPEDVYGPSEVIDPGAYAWKDAEWCGRRWREAVLYEMHIGTFTPAGQYRTAIERLDHLQDLGITAIELMAVADFPGRRNWGYDGVLWYAPDAAYGRPEDLKALIDAAHSRDMMVIFDVVYNHLGGIGNFMPRYWPEFNSSLHDTPWGKPPNFDGEGSRLVREFVIQNALYWIEEFHADGLRLDASHDMKDFSPRHILDELAERVHACACGRQVHLILEDERNASSRMVRDSDGQPRLYSAQWNHHMAHLRELPAEEPCSLRSAIDRKTKTVARMIALGYEGKADSAAAADAIDCRVPPMAYISFLQTHDLVGNDLLGQRIYAKAPACAVRALSAVYLLAPQIPMLFMGDEWGASTPFAFFCDFEGETAKDMREGRLKFLQNDLKVEDAELQRVPDPLAEETFFAAHLNWEELSEPEHADWLAWYRSILRVRREEIVPLLASVSDRCGTPEICSRRIFTARWDVARGARLILQANLCETSTDDFSREGKILWLEGTEAASGELGPWTVRWSIAQPDQT